MTEEKAIIGTIGLIAIKGNIVRLSVKNVLAIIGEATIIPKVKNILADPVKMRETTRILLIFSRSFFASASATRLDIATGNPSCVKAMTRNKVGRAII